MGLDLVEMIMRVEEEFEIAIPDEDVCELHTVDKLYHYILGKLTTIQQSACLTSHLFYRLCRAMMDSYGLDRRQIRPESRMEELIPPAKRREQWRRLTNDLGLSMPALERSPRINSMIVLLTIGLFALGVVGLLVIDPKILYLYVIFLILGAIGWGIALSITTRPLAINFPAGCQTVGQTVKALLGRHFKKLSHEHQKWNDRDVWDAMCAIIVMELGVELNEVVPEARFVEDLNAG